MSHALEEVERTLLLISEARERAEQAARSVKDGGGETRLVSALEEADSRLLALHGELMRTAYFPPEAGQLQLAG